MRGKFWLSADYPGKGMPIRSMICGKFWLSTNYPAERHALPQNNSQLHAFPWIILRKDMPFRGIIHGKSWLSENYTPERHTFPLYNPRKVLTFRGLSAESQKLRARISPRIREKIWKNFLTFIRDLLGVDSWKKTRPKNLMLQSL